MAAVNPAQTLQKEVTCPICLEYFDDPVSLDCGHNFCRACITQCWEGSQTVSCPQCRKTFFERNLMPNRQLRNIVEAARGLRLQSEKEAETEKLCEKHREPLKLFCKDDQIPICLVCDRSKEHRNHKVIPADEAADNFKEKIRGHLKTLREEREKLLEIKLCREKRGQENLSKAQRKRWKIVDEFQQLRQFLDEQERLLLAQLEKLEQDMVKAQDENITKLSAEISRLTELISEIEGKCLKPTNEFLQDVRSTLSGYMALSHFPHTSQFRERIWRCEKETFQEPEEISPEVEKGLSDFSQKTLALMEAVMTFKDTLPSALERQVSQVTVTLDPDTAHPDLILSEDGRSVRYVDRRRRLLKKPERFDSERWVLGRRGFTSGRCYWEVEVGDGRYWAVGVAKESVGRKGWISLSPNGGIWAVGWSGNQFWALTDPVTPLPQIWVPSRIRVCLDCDRGQVTFFDADDEAPIFTFPPGSVPSKRLCPWLGVGDTETQLCLHP